MSNSTSNSDEPKIIPISLQDEIYGISFELLFLADAIRPWLDEVSGSNEQVNMGLASMLESLGDRICKAACRIVKNEQRQKL